MKTFHNDKKIKELMLKEIKWHAEQDKIIQGSYESDGKYCAVGCSIQTFNAKMDKDYDHSDHSAYEAELGIPAIIAHLEDKIFEGLNKEEAKKWPLKFMKAVPVGVDLSLVWPKFAVWLLGDKKDGVIQHAKTDDQPILQDVVDLYTRKIAGEDISIEKWKIATSTTASAAYSAYTAATSAATSAVYVDYSAAYAAYTATYAAYAASSVVYVDYSAADAAAYAADVAADVAAYAADYAAYAAAYTADAAAYAADYAADAAAYAADAAAYTTNKKLYYKKCGNKLLDIIKETKI